MADPGLFGIVNSNKDLADKDSWGKNQFNNLFPVAMACYMRSTGDSPVYIKLDAELSTSHSEISVADLFGSPEESSELYFEFEAKFEPFEKYVSDNLESIDVVVKSKDQATAIRPIEIKLTTLPDNTTCDLSEDQYSCELVVRDKTTRYMALSMAEACSADFPRVREIFEPACSQMRHWNSSIEAKAVLPYFLEALEEFFAEFCDRQRPLLMQPVWKTNGKSSELMDNCLDLFVWSDFALSRLFMDSAKETLQNEQDGDATARKKKKKKKVATRRVTRQQRAAVRLARFLYEVSSGTPVRQAPIYDDMTFDTLNDKEFSITGNKTHKYLSCERLTKPTLTKSAMRHIILNNGQEWLSPERRFDAIVYYSSNIFK